MKLLLLIFSLFLSTNIAQAEDSQNLGTKAVVVHGKYCGYGMKVPGDKEVIYKPVDEIDNICLQHDFCYDTFGRRNCLCDETIVKQAKYIIETKELTRKQNIVAKFIIRLFSKNICNKRTIFTPQYQK